MPVLVGGIYLVKDGEIRLIPEDKRQIHTERRPVVVVSGGASNSDEDWPFILACPLSTSTTRRTKYDVQLNMGQGNVSKKTWIRIPAVQPLMKTDLQDHTGVLPGRILEEIQARLVQYMGMFDT